MHIMIFISGILYRHNLYQVLNKVGDAGIENYLHKRDPQ